MDFHYQIKNKKLKKMVESQAGKLGMTIDELIWGYVNRGLMSDNINEDTFRELHSEKYMSIINQSLDVD